jgi:hypothetical protein
VPKTHQHAGIYCHKSGKVFQQDIWDEYIAPYSGENQKWDYDF